MRLSTQCVALATLIAAACFASAVHGDSWWSKLPQEAAAEDPNPE